MPYRQKNYWPVLYVAAGFSGLVALGIAYFLVKALMDIEKIGGNPAILFLLLGMGFLIAAGGCIGTIMRKWWGRGILTFVSVLYLLVFPIGTILGFFVLRGLAIHKNEFR
jgi:hypothetical protein